jgi:hypothetical protein
MSNFTFLAAEFAAVHEAAVEAERQADATLSYGNIHGTI